MGKQIILTTVIRDGANRIEVSSEKLPDGDVAYSIEWSRPEWSGSLDLDLADRMAIVCALGGDPAGMGGS